MIFLGTLSLFQILLLPGFLCVLLLRINRGVLSTLLLSIGLSLFINYLLVFLFIILGIYRRDVFLLMMLLEAGGMLWWLIRYSKQTHRANHAHKLRSWCVSFFKEESLTTIATLLVACTIFLFYFFYLLGHFHPVFEATDPLFGFNAWAILWYQGVKHFFVACYPQLLPMNWSLTYLLINDSFVQLFNQILMAVIPFIFLLLFIELFVQTKSRYFLLGFILSGYLLFALVDWRVFSGFADLTTTFFAAFSLMILFLPFEKYSKKEGIKLILLGAVFAACSALTTWSGLLYAIAYPILLLWYIPEKFNTKDKMRLSLYSAAIILVLVGLSYGYFAVGVTQEPYGGFFSGPDQNIAYFLLSHYQRLIYGLMLLRQSLGFANLYILFPLILILGVLQKPKLILLFLWMSCYFFIWSFFFSYDLRNFVMLVPAFVIIAGVGLDVFIEFFIKYGTLVCQKKHLALLLVLLTLAVLGLYNSEMTQSIIQQQVKFKVKLGLSSLNTFIYGYFNEHPLDGKVLTNYRIFSYLPGLSEKSVTMTMDQQALNEQLQTVKPEYIFIVKVFFTEYFHGQECLARARKMVAEDVDGCNYTDMRDFARLHLDNKLSSYKAIFYRHHYNVVFDDANVLILKNRA